MPLAKLRLYPQHLECFSASLKVVLFYFQSLYMFITVPDQCCSFVRNFLCNEARADQSISFHHISNLDKSPKSFKHQASTKSRKYFQPPRCSVMYLKHVKYIVSLQDRLIPSHKSHRLRTSVYITLLFSRLSKQLGRSLGAEFRIILKNSKVTPSRAQISFMH